MAGGKNYPRQLVIYLVLCNRYDLKSSKEERDAIRTQNRCVFTKPMKILFYLPFTRSARLLVDLSISHMVGSYGRVHVMFKFYS